jgi:inner membrane protein
MLLTASMIWLIVGIVFMIAEIFVVGFVIFFFGVGALITALLTMLFPNMSEVLQIVAFIAVSIATLVFLRKSLNRIFRGRTYQKESNIKDFNLEVGKRVQVVEAIDSQKGSGRIRYQGTLWNAVADEDIPAGESVEILDQDNLTIKVKRA